jgi:hypothetical protein
MARAGCTYKFVPVLMDRTDARLSHVASGTLVRVTKASGLGVSGRLPSRFAYIELLDGTVLGMCCASSLQPRRAKSAMDIAADACGLKKVRGAMGGVYYE